MLFEPPAFLPRLQPIPDNIPICDFVFDERYGRRPIAQSLDAYTCGLSGRSVTARVQKDNVDFLARSLVEGMGWDVNSGSEFDKVIGVFAMNTVSKLLERRRLLLLTSDT